MVVTTTPPPPPPPPTTTTPTNGEGASTITTAATTTPVAPKKAAAHKSSSKAAKKKSSSARPKRALALPTNPDNDKKIIECVSTVATIKMLLRSFCRKNIMVVKPTYIAAKRGGDFLEVFRNRAKSKYIVHSPTDVKGEMKVRLGSKRDPRCYENLAYAAIDERLRDSAMKDEETKTVSLCIRKHTGKQLAVDGGNNGEKDGLFYLCVGNAAILPLQKMDPSKDPMTLFFDGDKYPIGLLLSPLVANETGEASTIPMLGGKVEMVIRCYQTNHPKTYAVKYEDLPLSEGEGGSSTQCRINVHGQRLFISYKMKDCDMERHIIGNKVVTPRKVLKSAKKQDEEEVEHTPEDANVLRQKHRLKLIAAFRPSQPTAAAGASFVTPTPNYDSPQHRLVAAVVQEAAAQAAAAAFSSSLPPPTPKKGRKRPAAAAESDVEEDDEESNVTTTTLAPAPATSLPPSTPIVVDPPATNKRKRPQSPSTSEDEKKKSNKRQKVGEHNKSKNSKKKKVDAEEEGGDAEEVVVEDNEGAAASKEKKKRSTDKKERKEKKPSKSKSKKKDDEAPADATLQQQQQEKEGVDVLLLEDAPDQRPEDLMEEGGTDDPPAAKGVSLTTPIPHKKQPKKSSTMIRLTATPRRLIKGITSESGSSSEEGN